ncbi:DUF6186 family protein [Nocardia cyriacigeorgica]|nr:DUF6186 family protein [Nocardia cyriacigeorgica]
MASERSSARNPTLVVALALRTRTARLLTLPLWIWLGWHFLAR